jgi:hypothetical protein
MFGETLHSAVWFLHRRFTLVLGPLLLIASAEEAEPRVVTILLAPTSFAHFIYHGSTTGSLGAISHVIHCSNPKLVA